MSLDNSELKRQVLQLVLTLGRRALIFWFICVFLLLGGLAIWLLQSVHLVMTITAISTLLAYVLAPAVQFLGVRFKLNRVLAISFVYLLCGVIATLALAYVWPVLETQAAAFTSNIGGYIHNLQHNLDQALIHLKRVAPGFLKTPLSRIDPESLRLETLIQDLQNSAPQWMGTTFVGVFSGVKAAAGFLTATVLIPLFTFYILMDAHRYKHGFIRLFPTRWKADVVDLLGRVDGVLGSYIRGQLLVCLIIGFSVAVLLSILGVPYAILIGVFAGVVDIIPYVGVAIGMVPAFIVAFGHKGLLFAILVVVLMEVVHWTEGHFIVPAIIGQSVGLPPLVVMIALGAGAELGGILGMFLSMPLAAILKVLMEFYVFKLERSEQQDLSAGIDKGEAAVEAAGAASDSEV